MFSVQLVEFSDILKFLFLQSLYTFSNIFIFFFIV